MTREEKIEQLERMLVNLPEIMSPLKVSKSVPIGKNRVYELIKTKELRAFIRRFKPRTRKRTGRYPPCSYYSE